MRWPRHVRSRHLRFTALLVGAAMAVAALPKAPQAALKYDLLLRGGHVIAPRKGINGVHDVAVAGGVIAAIGLRLDPAAASAC